MRSSDKDGCSVLWPSVFASKAQGAFWLAVAVAFSTIMVGVGPSRAGTSGYSCAGRRSTLAGTPRSDTLTGRRGQINVVQARPSGDAVTGRGRADLLCGGKGADRLAGGEAGDLILGQTGADIMQGGAGDDVLIGQAGADEADGRGGFDSCSAEVSASCERIGPAVDSFEEAIAAGEDATVLFMPGNYAGSFQQPKGSSWIASPGTRLRGELISGGGRSLLSGFEVYGAAVGVRCRPGSTCQDLDVHNHSQTGIQVGGGYVDLTDNYVHANNLDLVGDPLHNDNPCWNSGGIHMVVGDQVTLTGNRLINNGCDGVHSDTGMSGISYRDNLITDNTRFGIFIEVSCDQTITGNRIQNNNGHGVYIANSPRVLVTDNVFGGNADAIQWKDRATRHYGPGAADCEPKDKTGGAASGNTLNGDRITNAP